VPSIARTALPLALSALSATSPCLAADGWWAYPTQPPFGPGAFSRDGRFVLGGSAGVAAYSPIATGEIVRIGSVLAPGTQTPWTTFFTAGGSDSSGAPMLAGIAVHDCDPRFGCTRTAFRWSPSAGFVTLGNPSNPLLDTIATDTSADGAIIVGALQHGRSHFSLNPSPEGVPHPGLLLVPGWEATVWDRTNALQRLGFLPGGAMSVANATSADGGVVVGTAELGYANGQTGAVAFRWTATTGMVSLGTLSGDHLSYGTDVSDDGDVVVGASRLTFLPARTCCIPATRDVAFRWTPATGMQSLGYLPGLNNSLATAVSGDGRVIVGHGFGIDDAGNPVADSQRAFRWTGANGMQTVSQWLASAGVSLPAGLVLYSANDVDRTGETLIGSGRYDGQPSSELTWIARVGERGSGLLIDLPAYQRTLGETSGRLAGALESLPASAFDGARRRTLFDRGADDAGRGCAWAGAEVDFADERRQRRQRFEAGACRDIGRWRVGLGLGTISDRARFGMGSTLTTSARQLSAEVAIRFGPRLEADVQATRGEFDLKATRRYATATGTDASSGTGRGHYESWRARLSARGRWHAGDMALTPYVSVTRMRGVLEPFAEAHGSFPATYGGARRTSTEATLGLMGALDAGSATTITPSLEWNHRLADAGSSLRADTLGLLGTTITPVESANGWARVSIDVDHRIGARSNLRLSLAASSRDADRIGLGALYSMRF